MTQMRSIIVRSEEGKIVETRVVDKPITEAAKEVSRSALDEWDPGRSDFTVLRAVYELRYSLPIKNPDIIDYARDLGLEMRREGNDLVIVVPVYTISFENKWEGDTYMDKKMYVVALYVDDDSIKQIEEYASEATKEPKRLGGETQISLSEAELKALEEGLEELEEKPKKKRRSRRKKS